MYCLIVTFSADDSGYASDSSIVQRAEAEKACKKWCREKKVQYSKLGDYEIEDNNGFFYSFSVKPAQVGTTISTGQWR